MWCRAQTTGEPTFTVEIWSRPRVHGVVGLRVTPLRKRTTADSSSRVTDHDGHQRATLSLAKADQRLTHSLHTAGG